MSARKYKFRKRMLTSMAALVAASAVAAAFMVARRRGGCAARVGAVTVLYLGYLRRQTRIEERLRRRRAQRMAGSRLGVENTDDHEFDVVPSGCAGPARWCWRSTTRTRSSSTSTTRRSPATSTCRARRGSSSADFRWPLGGW